MSYKIKEVRRWHIYGLLLAISAKILQGQGIAASVRQHICYRYIIASKAVKFCSCLLCWSEHDLYLALRKNLCKNNQPQKNDFVLRAADQSLSFLFQYKLNTAVCQAPDTKYPDATERSEIRIFCGGISSACPDTLSQAHRAPCPSPEAALSIFWISPLLPDTVP